MFDRDLMKRTDDRPLQETPYTLDGVRVNIATDIFFDGVVDRLMPGIFVSNSPVRSPVVGVDSFGFVGNGFLSESVESLASPVWNHLEDNLAFPLDGSNNDGFVALVAMTFAPNFATNKSLVNLYDALEFDGRSVLDSGPDSVGEIPSGLVGNTERPRQLIRGYTLFGFNHQVSGHEPFVKGQVSVMEDCPGSNREVVFAIFTDELVALVAPGDLDAPAPETGNSIRPAEGFQVFPAPIFGMELVHQFN
ncbi:hypothetical protein LCGC14_0378820 [marine sediment metagenome]|uniref:Uncharacterized protein n=1 Tax=marine sediment metagenome TaxID=412755 RepID=A0A0F9T8W0_9ZZZZ